MFHIGPVGFEPTTSCSQSRRAAYCATARLRIVQSRRFGRDPDFRREVGTSGLSYSPSLVRYRISLHRTRSADASDGRKGYRWFPCYATDICMTGGIMRRVSMCGDQSTPRILTASGDSSRRTWIPLSGFAKNGYPCLRENMCGGSTSVASLVNEQVKCIYLLLTRFGDRKYTSPEEKSQSRSYFSHLDFNPNLLCQTILQEGESREIQAV